MEGWFTGTGKLNNKKNEERGCGHSERYRGTGGGGGFSNRAGEHMKTLLVVST